MHVLIQLIFLLLFRKNRILDQAKGPKAETLHSEGCFWSQAINMLADMDCMHRENAKQFSLSLVTSPSLGNCIIFRYPLCQPIKTINMRITNVLSFVDYNSFVIRNPPTTLSQSLLRRISQEHPTCPATFTAFLPILSILSPPLKNK